MWDFTYLKDNIRWGVLWLRMFTLEEIENPLEKIELPYKNANEYTWDIFVFLITEILRLHGIHILFPISNAKSRIYYFPEITYFHAH